MKKILFLSIALTVLSVNTYSQIQSTTIGGNWNDTNTWVGGVIPGASDDVVINGPVIQASASGYTILTEYCNNLTITSTGSLRNGDYGGGAGTFPVVVGGNVVNNGIVENGASDYLKIVISGDFENNNIWMPYETELLAGNNHNLSLAQGKSFGSKIKNYSSTLTALTDLYFTCDWNSDGNYHRDHFYLNGQTLVLGTHSIKLFPTCLINKGKLQGNFEILGTFTTGWAEGNDIRDTLVFEGNITITDTLTGNAYGGGYGIYKLKVIGNITNNGVIKDDYDTENPLSNDDLNLLITGNIINNGIWSCNYTTFIGTGPQYIYQAEGKCFDCYFTNLNSASSIIAQSDISVTKDINLNASTLDMANHTLKLSNWIKNGNLVNSVLQDGFLQNVNTLNSLTIKGKVTVDDGNSFQNTVIVEDTLQSNDYGSGSKYFLLPIIGDLTNNGVIQNNNPGDILSLELYGNAFNNGEWKNSRTRFVGSQNQIISQSSNKIFVTNFYDLDSTSDITASSNLSIQGNFNLGKAMLNMQGKEINLQGDLIDGKLSNPKIKNAKLTGISVYDSTEIRGIVKIDDGNYFYGNIIVTDTLQSIPYGSGAHTYMLYIYGNLENNGLIRDEPTEGEDFSLYVMGDIVNRGTFSNYRNHQLFFQNKTTNSVICYNNSTSNWLFNGATITENNSNAFVLTSGGDVQTISPNQSYNLTLQFTPVIGDTTGLLNINCTEIGTLNTIYLIGHNYNNTVDVEEEINTTLPIEFVLNQNYPNPFNPSTTIGFQLPASSNVTLKVYDILGNEVATLVDEYKPAGYYSIEFDGSRLSSGVYFYSIRSGDYFEVKKMNLMK